MEIFISLPGWTFFLIDKKDGPYLEHVDGHKIIPSDTADLCTLSLKIPIDDVSNILECLEKIYSIRSARILEL